MRSAVDNAHGSVRRSIELAEQSGCKPISLMAPRFGLVDLINGNVASFLRPGVKVRPGDNLIVPTNWPAISNGYNRLEGAATNKCTCAKSNPQDLTNITKSGDAAAVLSVVNDSTELAKVGLSAFGPNVYKLDNSAGTGAAYADFGGATGNTNIHSVSVFARGSGGGEIYLNGSGTGLSISLTPAHVRYRKEIITPSSATRQMVVKTAPGSIVYFILPQLEEGPVCTSPIPGGTGQITRASEGADTSGNGLSMPLSQAMVDSLVGELCPNYDFSGTYTSGLAHDWSILASSGSAISGSRETSDTSGSACVQRVTIATNSESKNNQIASTLNTYLVAGMSYEVVIRAKRLSGYATPKIAVTRGASTQWSNADAYTLSTWETHTTRFTATATGVGAISFGLAYNQAGDYLIQKVSVRRVLESGQTNPGEGTIIQWVSLPWDSSSVADPSNISILAPNDSSASFIYLRKAAGAYNLRLYEGVNLAVISGPTIMGRYAVISQYSAALGRMRVGLYNPATDALTWSHATLAGGATYRGFFPIHSSNRLRWFYGGGNYPIGIGPVAWLNGITPDAYLTQIIQEASRL